MQRNGRRGEVIGARPAFCRARPSGTTWRVLLAVGLGLATLNLSTVDTVLAQAAKKAAKAAPAAAKSDDEGGADAALKAYDAGVKSWQGGKADGAVEHLNTAIGTGKLPPQQMARALYYRGLAQRRLGKPALAISDLQSALWLKGALTEAERAEALSARTAAYREAGIADPNAGKISESSAPISTATAPKVSAAPAVRAAEAKAAPVAAPVQPAPVRDTYAPIGSRAEAPSARTAAASATAPAAVPQADWKTNVRGAARPQAAPPTTASVAPGPVRAAVPAPPATTEGLQGSAYAPGPAARQQVASAAPPSPAPSPDPQPAASGGGFLSNLFGGLAPSSSAPPAPEMPARRVPTIGLQEDPDAGKPPIGGTEPWGDAKVRPAARTARVASAAAAPAGEAAATGTFRLQVAAAKSKPEAERIAAQLKREQPKAVAQRTLEVDQVGGDNAQASVWRVRLGPFASANEPRNICVKLRQSGYDCMVVSQ